MVIAHLVPVSEVEVTLTTVGDITEFRIGAPSKQLAQQELLYLLDQATARRARYMFLGPYLWPHSFRTAWWVVHGEITEAKGEKG